MYKVELLSHDQEFILGIWKVTDFSKSMLPTSHSLFIRAVLFYIFISWWQRSSIILSLVQMYGSFPLEVFCLNPYSLLVLLQTAIDMGITVSSFLFFNLSN